jgi:TolB protein
MPPGTGHHLAVSGNRIAFVQVSTRDNLYSISMGKNGGRYSAPVPITLDTRLRKTNPGISPNGKLVCFGVAQIGRPNQLWIADMEKKTAQQIPVGRAAGNPAWLSDNEVMYWTPAHDTAPQLWKWNIAEGRTTRVLDSGQTALAFVRPSPDGHTAAFQRAFQGTMNVWSFSMDDKTVRQLTFNQSPVGWPAWSRDGKRLAVEVKTGGDTNIGLIPASGGPISMITHDSGQDWPYSWSPDDGQIAFAGQRNGRWNVFSVSVKTGAETQLTNYTAANTYVRYPEWSPTGDRIVYEYGESTGNIWMLEAR